MATALLRAFTNFINIAKRSSSGVSSTRKMGLPPAGSDPTLIKGAIEEVPGAFLTVFKNSSLSKSDAQAIVASLNPKGLAKLRKAVIDSGDTALAAKLFPDGATIRTVLAIGAGAGLIAYLDDKFKDSEEDFKDCMAGCLPHNWHEFKQGNVESTELEYSTPESLATYQITPIDNQPYCTSPNEKCEAFCQPVCKEETKPDIPLYDSPLNPFDPDSPFNPATWFKRFFGDLDLGIDTSMIGYASSASSAMCCLLVTLMLVMQFK